MSMKKVIFTSALMLAFLVGCTSEVSLVEPKVTERCYDGVVYIKERTGQSNLTVKFNSDSTVSTKLFSGISCEIQK